MRQNIPAVAIQKRLQKAKSPFLISWALTHRCNHNCLYCQIYKIKCREMNTKEALRIINELAAMGVMLICLSGGEPLLRDDIGEIINFIRKKKIAFDISSNGYLVEEKISQIDGLRALCLSLDGPQEIHDYIRRKKGAYKRVLEAARLAKKKKIPVYFRTVLSRLNLNRIDFILNLASRLEIGVLFQPATENLYGTDIKNPIAPFQKKYREAIDKLIMEKQKGNRFIQSPLPVLRYIRQWPLAARIDCISEKIFFHLGPDGKIYPCIWNRNLHALRGQDCLKLGVKKAIAALAKSPVCNGCWDVAAYGLNYSYLNTSLQNIRGTNK
ncbi:radical SAM protein [Candidatus Omnitrophota bacterium]